MVAFTSVTVDLDRTGAGTDNSPRNRKTPPSGSLVNQPVRSSQWMLLLFDLHICTHACRHVLTLHHTLYIHRDPQRIFFKRKIKKIALGISKSHLQKRKWKSQTFWLYHANLTFQQIILFYVVLGSQNYPEAHENRVVSTGEGLFKISFQPHPVSVLP